MSKIIDEKNENESVVKECVEEFGNACTICDNTEDLHAFKGGFVCRDCITYSKTMK